MTTPTREQVIAWAKDAGFGAYGIGLIEDGAAPEVANLCAIAMAYARAQALDEAAGKVTAKIVSVTASNSHRGRVSSVASFAVGLLDDLNDELRALKCKQ